MSESNHPCATNDEPSVGGAGLRRRGKEGHEGARTAGAVLTLSAGARVLLIALAAGLSWPASMLVMRRWTISDTSIALAVLVLVVFVCGAAKAQDVALCVCGTLASGVMIWLASTNFLEVAVGGALYALAGIAVLVSVLAGSSERTRAESGLASLDVEPNGPE